MESVVRVRSPMHQRKLGSQHNVTPKLFIQILLLFSLVRLLTHGMFGSMAPYGAETISCTTPHQAADNVVRDVLVGFAVNYDAAKIYPTLHAFHEMTGSQQHIALFVTLPKQVKLLLVDRFPRARLLDPEEVMGQDGEFMGIMPSNISNAAHSRYIYTAKWLSDQQNDYERVIMSDVRDIALYGDPFEQVHFDNDTASVIQTYTEHQTYRQQGNTWNQPWVRSCYGGEFLESIMDEKITCCGLVSGTIKGLLDYLHAFLRQLKDKNGCHKQGMDTAIHVWIIHKILSGVQIVDSEHALIRHYTPPEQLEKQFDSTTGGMFNSDGRPYSLIHQFDRHPALVEPYLRRHDMKLETDEFRHNVSVSD